jgi:hypothetical protein
MKIKFAVMENRFFKWLKRLFKTALFSDTDDDNPFLIF